MLKKLPLSNGLLSSLGCVNPSNREIDLTESVRQIQEITRTLEPGIDVVTITDE